MIGPTYTVADLDGEVFQPGFSDLEAAIELADSFSDRDLVVEVRRDDSGALIHTAYPNAAAWGEEP